MGVNMARNSWVAVLRAVGLVCSVQSEDEAGSFCMRPDCTNLLAYLDRAYLGISTTTSSVRVSIAKPCHLLMNGRFAFGASWGGSG